MENNVNETMELIEQAASTEKKSVGAGTIATVSLAIYGSFKLAELGYKGAKVLARKIKEKADEKKQIAFEAAEEVDVEIEA